jgi:excisionase family DNA binding protein
MTRFVYGPVGPTASRMRGSILSKGGGHEMQASGNGDEQERLLTPAEVAALFRVDPKTVTRWAKAGKLSSIRTLGGHRRYWEAEVRDLLERSAVS